MRTTKTTTMALIALALAGSAGMFAPLTPALAKPAMKPLPKSMTARPRGAATPVQIEAAGQAYARLTEADGMLNNFNSRAPVAAQELRGLLKTSKTDTQTLQALQLTLRDLMTKAKPAQASTVAVGNKYALLKTGRMSYADYALLLKNADAAHQAVLSTAKIYTQVYRKLRPNTPVANQAVNSRAMANYCEIYATKMAAFGSAWGTATGQR